MATVEIAPALRRFSHGQSKLVVPASTVIALFDAIEESCPGLRNRVLAESREVKPFVAVFVDDENIDSLAGLATPITDQSRVSILVAIAGG